MSFCYDHLLSDFMIHKSFLEWYIFLLYFLYPNMMEIIDWHKDSNCIIARILFMSNLLQTKVLLCIRNDDSMILLCCAFFLGLPFRHYADFCKFQFFNCSCDCFWHRAGDSTVLSRFICVCVCLNFGLYIPRLEWW